MNGAPPANFLLIDGAQRPDALSYLRQRGKPLDIRPLYLGTRFAELHDLGPLLVSLSGSSGLVHEMCQNNGHRPYASLLSSPAPIDNVTHHLQRFITPPSVRAIKGLLRFADPLVALHWLGSYQGPGLDAVLGPIEAWHVPAHVHRWVPVMSAAWQSFVRQAPPPPWDEAFARLDDAQHAALDLASRWRFKERLHLMLEQNHPQSLAHIDIRQLSQWFDERLDEAQAWGLVSERSVAIWAEYSLRWGAGFTQHRDGPYQHWLTHNPDASRLAPELRIQQMDNDRLMVNPHEDMP